MRKLTAAEKALKSLGITEPGDIDLEAIAWTFGVKVKFRPLDGCEARIIGKGDNAIVTVNSRSNQGRQRFSLAHELGHWEYHRGQIMVCRSDDIGDFSQKASTAEKRADGYAADLLMPFFLFQPAMRRFRKLDFDIISKLCNEFDVSFMAAAIRCVEQGDHAAILICHNQYGRRWFVRSSLVPGRWFPRDELQAGSSAMDVLFSQRPQSNNSGHRYVSAEAWFDRRDAHKYEILEQARRVSPTEVLSLLILEDEEMLED
jgi:hypothetical protein